MRFWLLKKLLVAVSLLLWWSSAQAATLKEFAWDESADAIGYNVYCGATPSSYGPPVDVGNVLSVALFLASGQTHYCAVKAYNGLGESVSFSNEAAFHIKPEAPGGFGRR